MPRRVRHRRAGGWAWCRRAQRGLDGDLLPGDALDTGDDADGHVVLGEDGALFDVALDVGVRRGQAYVGGPMKAGAGEFAARV